MTEDEKVEETPNVVEPIEEPLVELRNEFKDGNYEVTQFEDVPETCKVIVTVRDVETGEKVVSYGYIPYTVSDIDNIARDLKSYIEATYEGTKMYKV